MLSFGLKRPEFARSSTPWSCRWAAGCSLSKGLGTLALLFSSCLSMRWTARCRQHPFGPAGPHVDNASWELRCLRHGSESVCQMPSGGEDDVFSTVFSESGSLVCVHIVAMASLQQLRHGWSRFGWNVGNQRYVVKPMTA